MRKDFICTSTEPIVDTLQGRLRGFKLGSTYTFYGVKYANAKRWQQPVPPASWDGVRDALSYGYISPTAHPDSPNGDIMVPHRFWPKREDCQYLNIWTQSIDKDCKKPVMVWLHGGGFSDGSSVEMPTYDGGNLSEFGDVVVVSLNHRLNILGYLNVSQYGERFKNSGNAGNADIVAALRWIHQNIASFGGDPGNVTIFGQSGGGMKASSLMQTPEADGLFHKVIIQSGSAPNAQKIKLPDSAPVAKALLAAAGTRDIEVLEKMPHQELIALFDSIHPGLIEKGIVDAMNWGPVENEYYVNTIFHGSTKHAKTIPMMIGSSIAEMGGFSQSIPGRNKMTEHEKKAYITQRLGVERGEKLIELFSKAYPQNDLLDALVMDDGCRITTLMIADMRAKEKAAPLYNYIFAHDFSFDDGRPAWHCAEIPYVFHNVDKAPLYSEPVSGEKLEKQFASAWVNFAYSGDPNNSYMPKWEPYTVGGEFTMVIDTNSYLSAPGFDKELIKYHESLQAKIENPDMLM